MSTTLRTTAAPPLTGGRLSVTCVTALAPVAWGTIYLTTTELLPPGHPLFASLVRALPAGLLVLALVRTLPRGAWWWRSAVLGTVNMGVFFPLLFLAAERLPGGVAATLAATQPVVVALLAAGLLHERLSLWRLAGCVAGVVGVGLVVLGPDAALDPLGVGAGVASAGAMGLGITLTKRWGRPAGVGPMTFAGWQLTAGGLVLLIPVAAVEGLPAEVDAAGVAGYLWLGLVCGSLTYTLWFRGLGMLPATSTALLGLLSPLVAAALGAAVLSQTLTLVQLVGFVVALTALAAGQIPSSPHRKERSRS